ncbi:DNA-directed RNA polymerase III subunit RPC7-like [Exaiptasia diaphana]|nr:DNA-directed RNA polymerase III subunit RPC7-like [Exaiptasia diaphana]
MAGRGGRGRGGKGRGFTFDIGAIGFGRGSDALPAAILQPPPLFPPLERRPLPLRISEKDDYMLVLKEEFRMIMNTSPYYIKPDAAKKDIERYSDRFKENQQTDSTNSWTPDWNHFPAELKVKTKTSKSHGKAVKPNTKNSSRKRKLDTSAPDIDFDSLEKEDEKENENESGSKPTQESKATEGKADPESEEEIDEEDYDEEEQEEVQT